MPVYMLSIGNSSDGPIGLVARIHADSPEEAVERFNGSCAEIEEKFLDGFDYVNTYTNAKHITVADIVDSESEDCNGAPGDCEYCGSHQEVS